MKPDYKAIADEVEAKSYIDYNAAFVNMSAETVNEDKTEARITEAMILSGLGLVAGTALIDHIETNYHASVVRVLQGEGINVADAEAKAALAADTGIPQPTKDWIAAQAVDTKPKWPGLKAGHIQMAIRYRELGEV